MCLSVYLGTDLPLSPREFELGDLAFEQADWRPIPVRECAQIYFLGRKGENQIECSCLLSEGIYWDESGPVHEVDPLMDAAPHDPKATLQRWCKELLSIGSKVWLVCDDDGGVPFEAEAIDYAASTIGLSDIHRGTLLFEDENGQWTMKAMEVVASDESPQNV